MPKCPECGIEYVAGVKECTECKVPLIDDEEAQVANRIAIVKVKEALADRLVDYLNYCKVGNPEKMYDEDEDIYVVVVDEADADIAIKNAKVLLMNEMQPDEDETEGESEDPDQADFIIPEEEKEDTGVYVSKQERYEDLRSSASAFTIVGIVCVVLSVLMIAGIVKLPLNSTSELMMKLLLAVMGIAFAFIGFNSHKKAKALEAAAANEDSEIDSLLKDFLADHTAEGIDEAIYKIQPDIDPTLLAFQRLDLIRRDLQALRPELRDGSYLDEMSDRLYTQLFEE